MLSECSRFFAAVAGFDCKSEPASGKFRTVLPVSEVVDRAKRGNRRTKLRSVLAALLCRSRELVEERASRREVSAAQRDLRERVNAPGRADVIAAFTKRRQGTLEGFDGCHAVATFQREQRFD